MFRKKLITLGVFFTLGVTSVFSFQNCSESAYNISKFNPIDLSKTDGLSVSENNDDYEDDSSVGNGENLLQEVGETPSHNSQSNENSSEQNTTTMDVAVPGSGDVPVSNSSEEDNEIAKSCGMSLASKKAKGQVACFGIWEYGNVFGGDRHMCSFGSNPYMDPDTGCVKNTSLCASGKAMATRILNINDHQVGIPMASDDDIERIAMALVTTEETVQKYMVRVWEYSCL